MKTSHGLLTLTIVYYSRNYVIGHSKIDMRKVVSYLQLAKWNIQQMFTRSPECFSDLSFSDDDMCIFPNPLEISQYKCCFLWHYSKSQHAYIMCILALQSLQMSLTIYYLIIDLVTISLIQNMFWRSVGCRGCNDCLSLRILCKDLVSFLRYREIIVPDIHTCSIIFFLLNLLITEQKCTY